MLLNIRRIGAVWFLLLLFVVGILAQLPTSGDVMRDRIKKAKGLVAVKNYNAAIYELEGIRKETNDATVGSVAQVMLMNCYLEQSDYKRAQNLLTEMFNAKKTNRLGGENYYAVAGQVVRGAKVQLDRYKALGLMVSDANLPPDAVADINKMRETVEIVITQSKALGLTQKENSNAMALLEEATGARGNLARDDYDAKRWKDEVADARDSLMNSGKVVDAVGDASQTNTVAAVNTNSITPNSSANPSVVIPVADKTNGDVKIDNKNTQPNIVTARPNETETKSSMPETVAKTDATAIKTAQPEQNQNTTAANSEKSHLRMRKVENNGQASENVSTNNVAPANVENTAKNNSPLTVGSLIEYATAKVNPTYPAAAKITRAVGVVRVDLIIDEQGKVEVQNSSGPGILKQAALDAVKRWKFKPFLRDGQPVKATGYVNFNFNL